MDAARATPTGSAPARPAEVQKRDWRRAWKGVVALYRDSSRTEQVFEILDALEGPDGEADFQEFAAHPEGRRLLEERPSLLGRLAAHEGLRALPEGSLGRAYLAFMEEAGLNAQELVDAELARPDSAIHELGPDRRWLADRGRDSHDLWHVLTGYGRDEAGEAALLAFTYANYPHLGIALILLVALLIGPKTPSLRWERYLWQAYRRGRKATLDFARYEDWLPLPLDEVQARAGIVPPEIAHPATGIVAASRDGGKSLAFGVRT